MFFNLFKIQFTSGLTLSSFFMSMVLNFVFTKSSAAEFGKNSFLPISLPCNLHGLVKKTTFCCVAGMYFQEAV